MTSFRQRRINLFLIFLSLVGFPSLYASQEFLQWGLPDGARARLGKGVVTQIQYSPDGTRLAVGSGIGIWIYDTTTYREVDLFAAHEGGVWNLAYSPDGSVLASGSSDKTIRLWNAAAGEQLRTLEGHDPPDIIGIIFSPVGDTHLQVRTMTVTFVFGIP